MTSKSASPAILWGGLIAGVLDIIDAFAFYALRGGSPVRLLQAIAAGLLGPQAFKGSSAVAALGAVLHFSIALSAAAVYYIASRKIILLTRRPYLSGLLYGCLSVHELRGAAAFSDRQRSVHYRRCPKCITGAHVSGWSADLTGRPPFL